MKNLKNIIIFVILAAFFIRILFPFYEPMRGWDETVYLNLGKDLSDDFLGYTLLSARWNDFIPSDEMIYAWPNVGFRAPLLPYVLAVFYRLNFGALIPFVVPFLGAMSVLLVYILGKKLFDKKIALYSAVFFALIPIHVFYSQKMWTDPVVVFFILATFISFWEGYEKENNKHKIFFGVFLALSLLARYTALWIIPVFFFYFLFRDKSLKFLRDKYLWYAAGIFLVVLTPWFFYGYSYYGNPLGGFIHGFKASSYWGGVQLYTFFFAHSWEIFSAISIIFLAALFYIFIKREFFKKEIYLLLIWIGLFSAIVVAMPHKEERFILPIIPAVCLLSGFFISKLGKWKNLVFGAVCIVLAISLWGTFKLKYEERNAGVNVCFSNGNEFLAESSLDKDSVVVTNQLPIVHYYTGEKAHPYPELWNITAFKNDIDLNYPNRKVYIFYANYDMMNQKIKNDLDANYKKVFECSKGWGYSAVYEYD